MYTNTNRQDISPASNKYKNIMYTSIIQPRIANPLHGERFLGNIWFICIFYKFSQRCYSLRTLLHNISTRLAYMLDWRQIQHFTKMHWERHLYNVGHLFFYLSNLLKVIMCCLVVHIYCVTHRGRQLQEPCVCNGLFTECNWRINLNTSKMQLGIAGTATIILLTYACGPFY